MTRAKGNMPNKETEEHGFPKWMMKFLSDIGDPDEGVTHTIREGVRGPVLRQWSAGTFDIVARKVFRECNQGWMDGLERAVRPHLIPILEGQRRVLDGPAQRILSAWAVKTALALALANSGSVPIDSEHYRALVRTKARAPRHTNVWIAAYSGPRAAFYQQYDLTLTDSAGSYPAFGIVFSLGRPIFQVAGYPSDLPVEIIRRTNMPATERIWPLNGLTHWPPAAVMDDENLLRMATSWDTKSGHLDVRRRR
jgi:hypothetical protein